MLRSNLALKEAVLCGESLIIYYAKNFYEKKIIEKYAELIYIKILF